MEKSTLNEVPPILGVRLWLKLLENVAAPLAVIMAGLFIEYRSGYFHEIAQTQSRGLSLHFWLASICVSFFATIMFAKDALNVWFHPHEHVREQFSVLGLCTVLCLTVTVLLCAAAGLMPWAIPQIVVQTIRTGNIPSSDVRTTDLVLLLMFYVLIVFLIIQQQRNWHGSKSIAQYSREQRRGSIDFVGEGVSELVRLLRREPPLQLYSPASQKDFILQLQPVTDSLVWRDRVKELVRLSSSSYAFDPETGWHDREQCWVGDNVNTDELVFLYPIQSSLGAVALNDIKSYCDRVASKENKRIAEIIIAQSGDDSIDHVDDPSIRWESENSLLDHLVDFKDYHSDIKRRVRVNTLPDSSLTLSDIYVPSHFYISAERSKQTLEEFLDEWLEEHGQRQLALLGEYGQGKSTAALMWTYRLITQSDHLLRRIPILIDLRGSSPRNLTPLRLLGAWAAQYSINAQALMRLLIAGRLIVIFEGFDEMALVGDAEMRLKHFRTLWQFAYPASKILITGRPNFFLDEEEMKAALGIGRASGGSPYCEAIRLAPFDVKQIRQALRANKDSVRDQISDLALKNSRFRELVSRPSLLHIVAVLWERERLFDKVDRLTSAYVMDLFVRHSYRRQGLKESDASDFMALTTLEREYFMDGIAAYMASHRLPNQIGGNQLTDVINDLLNNIPESVSTSSPAILGETTQPLRNRVKQTEHGVEHVRTDVRACGLLVDDPAAPGTFRFGHKSFMEYLFASVIAERIQHPDSDKARAILKITNSQLDDILSLPVAADFLSELLVGMVASAEFDRGAAKHQVATELFNTILGETGEALLQRPVALFEIATYFLTKGISLRRRFRRLVWLCTAMALIVLSAVLIPRIRGRGLPVIEIPLFSAFALFFSLFMMATVSWRLRRKLSFWYRLCKELSIPSKVMHQVVGTNFIPVVRKRPFEYEFDPRDEIMFDEGKRDRRL